MQRSGHVFVSGKMTELAVERLHVRARPVRDWLRCAFRTRYVSAGFLEEDGEVWDTTGRLVAEMVTGEPPFVDPSPYLPERFSGAAR